jgi:cytochrome c oxidase accessory protein FixG
LGDCLDCTLCVQVCPTGIDIRNGLQYQCIACGACVDVCDSVMEKMTYPKGLIRYTTQNELEQHAPRRILRPRVFVYGGMLAAIGLALVVSVFLRVPAELDVIRDRNSLFRDTPTGLIENVYTLKIMNMDSAAHSYAVSAKGIPGLVILADQATVTVRSGEVVELPVRLQADPNSLTQRSTPVTFTLQATDDVSMRVDESARFIGPRK